MMTNLKTKGKHIICILLMLSMIFSLMPTAFAAEEITRADINSLSLPVIGAKPDYDVSVPADAHYHLATPEELEEYGYDEAYGIASAVTWVNLTQNQQVAANDTFSAGDSYYASFFLIADDGYSFPDNPVSYDVYLYVNGNMELADQSELSGDGRCLYFSSRSFVASPAEIESVSVSGIDAPVAGANPNYGAVADEAKLYKVHGSAEYGNFRNGVYWYDLTDGKLVAPTDEFEDGHKYRVFIDLQSVGENVFLTFSDGNPDVTATVNGQTASVTKYMSVNAENEINVYCDFDCISVLIRADVGGLTLPVIGATPDFEATVPADAHYHLATPEELDELGYGESYGITSAVTWVNLTQNQQVGANDTFSAGETYYASVFLIADVGYVFPANPVVNDVVVYVNGNAELADQTELRGDGKCLTFFTKTLVASPAEIETVEVTGITMPVDGKNPDFNINVPAGANYTVKNNADSYSINGLYWWDSEVGAFMTGFATFEAEKYYWTEFYLEADFGYKFADEVEVSVNGEFAYVVSNDGTTLFVNSAEYEAEYAPIISDYTVTYDANGGTGTMNKEYISVDSDGFAKKYTFPQCVFTAPAGKEFDKWEWHYDDDPSQTSETTPGNSPWLLGNITVKALWKDIPVNTYTVTYDANGGTGTVGKDYITTDIDGFAKKYTFPQCPFTAPAGKEFDKWEWHYDDDPSQTTENTPGNSPWLSGNITVKALWKDISVTPPVDNPAEKMLGDLDGNGKITAADARLALRISSKLDKAEAEIQKVADIDKNGKVTASDARCILRFSAKLDKVLGGK